jgi:site-specific DNA recombinase
MANAIHTFPYYSFRGAPKAAAIYTRISKDNGSRLGVDRQEDLCRELADSKGWPVAEVYEDNDISAYQGARRPDYERMLADLETGARDAVLVVDQDRLTRHPMELESFITTADRLGIPLANVSGEVDLSPVIRQPREVVPGADTWPSAMTPRVGPV